MARTALLTLLFCAFAAAPANAAWVAAGENLDWPPTTDFQLTEDPCAAGQCQLTATITFAHKGKRVGSIPLHSPPREGGEYDTKSFGHVDDTSVAEFFWSCATAGEHTWSAEISKVEGGRRTDYPAESGSWTQPGCSDGVPRRVSRAKARATAKKKVIFGDRKALSNRCKRTKREGRWACKVRWTNASRTCTDTQLLFFYSRVMFGRRFDRVSSVRDARRCTANS